MNKLQSYQFILTIAQSRNFSDYGETFDKSDDGKEEEAFTSRVNADFILMDILSKLDDKAKVILLCEILKGDGYGLDREICARTLSISKATYSNKLKRIRESARKALQGATANLI